MLAVVQQAAPTLPPTAQTLNPSYKCYPLVTTPCSGAMVTGCCQHTHVKICCQSQLTFHPFLYQQEW